MSTFGRNRLKSFRSGLCFLNINFMFHNNNNIILLSAGYTSNEKQDSFLIVVGMMIVIIAFCYMLGLFSPAQIKTNTLFGREDDKKNYSTQFSMANIQLLT